MDSLVPGVGFVHHSDEGGELGHAPAGVDPRQGELLHHSSEEFRGHGPACYDAKSDVSVSANADACRDDSCNPLTSVMIYPSSRMADQPSP